MIMVADNQQRPFGAVPFDVYQARPRFNDGWSQQQSTASSPSSNQPSHTFSSPPLCSSNMILPAINTKPLQSSVSAALPFSTTVPVSAPSILSTFAQTSFAPTDLINLSQDVSSPNRSSYSSDRSFSRTSSPLLSIAYLQQQQQSLDERRTSHSNISPYLSVPEDPMRPQRQTQLLDLDGRSAVVPHFANFDDTLDAGRGMVAMSQTDLTPRNIYASAAQRASADSYGFPSASSTHSTASSISSCNFPYLAGSVDSSATEYSSASEAYEPLASRTLPRPASIITNTAIPPPQSMMGQFNSKISQNTQKKHKCKVCEKRFTRPSSLQTHIYSHTGEKPFACDVEGCGRHFSVVSNLRRHKKVHRLETDHSSPE